MSFESFLTQQQRRPKKGRRITYAMSLLLHAVALCVAVASGFWKVDELSLPAAAITLRTIATPPPPPPPAGAPRRTSRRVSKVAQPRSKQVVQPPEDLPKEEEETPDGPVGEKEGVPGGIVGSHGIGPPPPPVKETFVPPKVATGRLAIDPYDERYQARLPAALARAGMSLWALLKVCVGVDGQVNEVTVIRGADPAVDPIIVAAIKTWRYHPYTVDGRPVPFCTNVRYEISTSVAGH
jgi:hypothetical protein